MQRALLVADRALSSVRSSSGPAPGHAECQRPV